MKVIGIRKETKNIWERRTPLIPDDVKELRDRFDIHTIIQPSSIRVYTDDEYSAVGATVNDDLSAADVIFGVKEMPVDFFVPGKTYVFFSHTIKGQPHNMPMLKRLMELNCQLIDYERITDDDGRRLIFFGRFAGIAGMLDTLWGLGQRLLHEGIETPFLQIKRAVDYHDLNEARSALQKVATQIRDKSLPTPIIPLVIGITGYGNVSKGVQEVLSWLPVVEVTPSELPRLCSNPPRWQNFIYKVVFKEEDMVEPLSPNDTFDLYDYYQHPEKYRSKFTQHLPYLTVLINAIYWDSRYPRLVTKSFLKAWYTRNTPRLKIIGDISCDIEGAIECTVRTTTPGDPFFVYDPITGDTTPGLEGPGIPILAVDNLPAELPRDASREFSKMVKPFVPYIVDADYSKPFDKLNLPPALKRAVIVHQGKLTPNYQYLSKYIDKYG